MSEGIAPALTRQSHSYDNSKPFLGWWISSRALGSAGAERSFWGSVPHGGCQTQEQGRLMVRAKSASKADLHVLSCSPFCHNFAETLRFAGFSLGTLRAVLRYSDL